MGDGNWVLYILECRDNTFYTGITNDFEKRLKAHNSGCGAKYTRGKGPFVLRYMEQCNDHSHALRREIEVKRLTKDKKIALCKSSSDVGRG